MEYRTDLKIEYCYENCLAGPGRYFYYRIKPSELPFWKRWFFNPWRQMFHAYKWLGGYNYLYKPIDYQNELLPLKTFGDVCNYLSKQRAIIEERHNQRVQRGEAWPDEY